MAPLSPQPKAAKEKPADPLDIGATPGHARAPARAGHNSLRAAEAFADRIIAQIDSCDADIRQLNRRKAELYGELRARGYDVSTIKFRVKEGRLDPLMREARDHKRASYGNVGANRHARDDRE
jgi:uncharacterized protein (UPF0335 family)